MEAAVKTASALKRMMIIVSFAHLAIFLASVCTMQRYVQEPAKRLVVNTVTAPSMPLSVSTALPEMLPQEVPVVEEVIIQEPVVAEEPAAIQEPAKAPPVQEPPPVQEIKQPQVPKVVKKPEVKKPEVKKSETKTVKKETVTPKKPVETNKKTPSIDNKLLQELQKELKELKALDAPLSSTEKITPTLPTLSAKLKPPAAFNSLPTEEDYVDKLRAHLQASLKLPDVGEVTMGLTLAAGGTVAAVEIVKKTSAVNERYVLEQVPNLTFPSWGKGDETRYFPVTLRSK